MSVSHKSEEHIHETHGHKTTTLSGHGVEREEEEDEKESKGECQGVLVMSVLMHML